MFWVFSHALCFLAAMWWAGPLFYSWPTSHSWPWHSASLRPKAMKPGTKDWNLWTMSQKFIFPKLFGQYFVTVIEGWLTNKDLVSFLEEKKSYPIQIGYSILFPLDSYFNFWVNGAFVFFVMMKQNLQCAWQPQVRTVCVLGNSVGTQWGFKCSMVHFESHFLAAFESISRDQRRLEVVFFFCFSTYALRTFDIYHASL
jgi:hypothetical protein